MTDATEPELPLTPAVPTSSAPGGETEADAEVPATADGVRERNTDLDDSLRALVREVTRDLLQRDPGGDEWTVAQLLAHLGEFPRFFAADLGAWLDAVEAGDEPPTVGRTAEHPVRLAAVGAAGKAELEGLRTGVEAAFQELGAALGRLDDAHLTMTLRNVKYGEEPLPAYLDRYVLGHKAAHVDQLRRTIDSV